MSSTHVEQAQRSLHSDSVQLLSDAELDACSGGVDCATATAVARAYNAASMAMQSVNQRTVAIYFAATATTVTQGRCS